MSKPVALITGASRGLGAELAKSLSSTYHIIAVARTIGALEELDDQIKKRGGSSTLTLENLAPSAECRQGLLVLPLASSHCG